VALGEQPGVLVGADELLGLSQSILEAVGTPSDLASTVAQSLVDANLAGHDSHGVLRLPSYVEGVRDGRVMPAARAQRLPQDGACARIDGAWGWGQPAAHLATDTAAQLADTHGVGVVAIGRCNHIGRLGEYVEKLTRAGKLGMAMCNTNVTVAPYGGFTRLLGTNPIAWGAPRAEGKPPLVMDFATATIAEGKLRVARAIGGQAPPGAVVDREGRPTQDPAAFYDGGALTAFGGHKGFGLSVMVELMGGILSGSGASSLPEYDNGNGTVLLALEVERFLPAGAFRAQAEAFSEQLHRAPPAPGFDAILLPGEPEARSRAERAAKGIPLPAATAEAIADLAMGLGLPRPHFSP
jgi:LDH2 family malate/lactate/ureidoglycolate dehydrogenase